MNLDPMPWAKRMTDYNYYVQNIYQLQEHPTMTVS